MPGGLAGLVDRCVLTIAAADGACSVGLADRQPAAVDGCRQWHRAGIEQRPGLAAVAVQAAILSQRLAAFLDSHKQSAHGEPLPALLAGDFNSLWRKITSDAFDEVHMLRRLQQAVPRHQHWKLDTKGHAFGFHLHILRIECAALLPMHRCHRGLLYTAACTSFWQQVAKVCHCRLAVIL